MLTPLILFLGLTVATAVIAYWSDNLGKKLGKKRVSLLGLRPRTTATVLTITSSWAIMLFTLAVLLAVATPLRNAIFHYEQDIAAAKTILQGTQNQLSRTENSLSTANRNLKQSQSEIKEVTADIKKATSDAKKAEANAKQALVGEKQAQAGAKIAQNRAVTAQKREKEARRGEQEAESLRNQASRELNAASISLVAVRNKFNATQNRLGQTREQLVKVEDGLRNAEASYARARKFARDAGPEVYALERQTFALRRQRNDLQKEVKGLEAAARLYSVAAVQLAGGDVRIAIGRTFAARIVAARESPANVEAQLRQILAQGQAAFAQTPETESLYQQGARLILFPLPEKGADNTPVLRALAQIIASNGAATSVRLVAAFNSTAEEKQIAVRFITVPVDVAFREGEILASATIEGAGDANLFRELNNLIEDGREEAVKRKVNPPLWLAEPNFYAPGTDVGLFEALRRIQANAGAKRVRLVAAQDLSTVEPLRVRFEVENAPTS